MRCLQPIRLINPHYKKLARDTRCDLYDFRDRIDYMFKNVYLDKWADIFKLKKSGANISPLSSKNLPQSDYIIDKEDEEKCKVLLINCDKTQKMLIVKKAVKTITNKFTKKQNIEMKKLNMKPKQYIHYIGKWDKLLEEIKKETKNANM